MSTDVPIDVVVDALAAGNVEYASSVVQR